MKAEVIGIGTELLLGQIANTNAQKISTALATIGVDVYFHTAVGDNLERIKTTIAAALRRSDAVVITGGLGPTSDDITAEAVAAAVGRPLVRDERLAALIRGFFEGRGRPMPDSNLKQADLPSDATPIEPEGTAPGFYVEERGSIVFCLPGVPWEMEAMLAKTVLPVLGARAGDSVTVSRHVLTVGLGESALAHAIDDIVQAQTNPTVAFLAGGGTPHGQGADRGRGPGAHTSRRNRHPTEARGQGPRTGRGHGRGRVLLAGTRAGPEGGYRRVTDRWAARRHPDGGRRGERFLRRLTGLLFDRGQA